MRKGQTTSLIYFTIILFVIGIIVNYLPITIEGKSLTEYMAEILGLNTQDVVFPNFIWWVLLPLISSTAMILALMNFVTRWLITDKNLNLFIAVTWAFIAILTPARYVVWGLLSFLGAWGIGVWAFIFVFGTIFLSRKFYKHPEKFIMLNVQQKIADLTQKEAELLKKHTELVEKGDMMKAAQIKTEMDNIRREIKYLQELRAKMATE
jgi:hypothetical protein